MRIRGQAVLWLGNVSLDPPESTFSEGHILAPRGCCSLKFLHALENDQGLLASENVVAYFSTRSVVASKFAIPLVSQFYHGQ